MKIITTVLIIFFATVINVSADTVIIENDISVSARTGGNSASKGEVIRGEGRASIDSVTTVNGEIVDEVREEVVSETEDVEIVHEIVNEINTSPEVNEEPQVKEEFVIETSFEEAIYQKEESKDFNQEKKPIKKFLLSLISYVWSIFAF